MSKSAGKCRKRYVDHPNDRSKLTYIFYGPGHSSDGFKVLGGFGSKYSKIRPTKDYRQDTTKINKFNRKQENNAMVHNEVDVTIVQCTNNFST